jgi:hypothetical protein
MKRKMDLKWIFSLRERFFKERWVPTIFLATALVFGSLGGFIHRGLIKLEREEKQTALFEKKTKNFVTSIKKRENFLEEYKGSDEEYLKNSIESVLFLKRDIELLSKLQDEGYTPFLTRLEYLSGEGNRLKFVSSAERRLPPYVEREWILEHRVELNTQDLTTLLSSIEGRSLLKPQLIIKKMDLEFIKNSMCSLDLEILQRGAM